MESEDDDVYDEIDLFTRKRRRIEEGEVKQKKAKRVEEVLSVEADVSEEDEEETDDDSDFESTAQKDEPTLPSKETWGQRRKDFYSTGYIDDDFGEVASSDEDDLAKLEEIDAMERQMALDETGGEGVLGDVWGEYEVVQEEETQKKEKNLLAEAKWTLKNVMTANPKLVEIRKELVNRRNIYNAFVKPMVKWVLPILPKHSPVRIQIQSVSDIYTQYILNLMFFIDIKSASFAKRRMRDKDVDDHPVLDIIQKINKLLKAADLYLEKNGVALNNLLKRAKEGADVVTSLNPSCLAELKGRPKKEKKIETEENIENAEGQEEEDEEEEGKRGVTYAIQKNKQMGAKKKKAPAHSRAAKRKQYSKALVRRRSQIPDIRREEQKYSGEARGIRAYTIKSIKLKA